MTDKQEKINTFAKMEKSKTDSKTQESITTSGEININDFSDVAIGEKVKYVRPDLDGKDDVIDKFQVFMPDTNEEPLVSQSGTSKYWKVSMIISYESKNVDGVNNREYFSGSICFQQRDGTASQPNFWYKGCEHQSGVLWELVAAKLDVDPENLSPRQFVAFLNSKPKIKISGTHYKNFGSSGKDAKTVKKNMVGKFI